MADIRDKTDNQRLAFLCKLDIHSCRVNRKLPGNAVTVSESLLWVSQCLSRKYLHSGGRKDLLILCRVFYVEHTGQNTLMSVSMRS
jgi:hypothetical protein